MNKRDRWVIGQALIFIIDQLLHLSRMVAATSGHMPYDTKAVNKVQGELADWSNGGGNVTDSQSS